MQCDFGVYGATSICFGKRDAAPHGLYGGRGRAKLSHQVCEPGVERKGVVFVDGDSVGGRSYYVDDFAHDYEFERVAGVVKVEPMSLLVSGR